jgi:hypothetical protein
VQVTKQCDGGVSSVSGYCPADLYSDDDARMAHALRMLLESPQNNFRLFVQGEVCDGAAVSDGALHAAVGGCMQPALRNSVAASRRVDVGADASVAVFLDTVRFALRRTCVLQAVLALQQLDAAGIQHVAGVFDAVMAECGGDASAFMAAVRADAMVRWRASLLRVASSTHNPRRVVCPAAALRCPSGLPHRDDPQGLLAAHRVCVGASSGQHRRVSVAEHRVVSAAAGVARRRPRCRGDVQRPRRRR